MSSRQYRAISVGGSVLLSGPAGIGKTKLDHEVCRREAADAGVVDRVLGTGEESARPLGPLLSLGVLAEDMDMVAGFRSILRNWSDRGNSTGPVVLWLDDAHHGARVEIRVP